jgi:Integrase zinc binding domain/RNase H-like domain found in reverse transcriptase
MLYIKEDRQRTSTSSIPQLGTSFQNDLQVSIPSFSLCLNSPQSQSVPFRSLSPNLFSGSDYSSLFESLGAASTAFQIPPSSLLQFLSAPSLSFLPRSLSSSRTRQFKQQQGVVSNFAMIAEVQDSPKDELPPSTNIPEESYLKTTKKYKPVALKVKPILGELPDKFRIIRNIVGDPLANLPTLNPIPPKFAPFGRYTEERKELFDKANAGFLWPSERDLLHHFMVLHQDGFAWDDSERGHFREDFFPPVDIPVVPHTPWVLRNIPIPPGIYDEVCKILKKKLDAGVFEPSNSSYRSRWFCVAKKDGVSLRMVQSLEPLNAVTIQHSGVPPFTDQIIDRFSGRACGSMMDLFVGYDERALAPSSRDYTTFQSPFGPLRLTTLPMGWTNSVPIFHDDVTHILQQEIPHVTQPYIDDVPVRGPESRYVQPDGKEETIPENPGIRRFVWEHFQDLNRVVQRMKYAGGTFSGYKSFLCAEEITVLGHRCTMEGRRPEKSRVEKIVNWGPCINLSDVRAFLGTVGVCRIFIRNFAHRAHNLVKLTRKDVPWEFGQDQLDAMKDLKDALISSPALRPIDYQSDAPVILSVDTSNIAIGLILAQCDPEDTKRRFFAKFGSITLNDRESRYSQPKLELYGLYRALRSLKMYLLGVRNLIVEVDAKFIKGMLANPDIAPSASINRWILGILMFHFTLVHVPGTHHGPDGLSRRRPQPGDEDEPEDDFEDWVDQVNGFLHFVVPLPSQISSISTSPPISSYVTDTDRDDSPEPDEPSQDPDEGTPTPYSIVPRSDTAQATDEKLIKVKEWLDTLERPLEMSDSEYKSFLRYCVEFFLTEDLQGVTRLWRKDKKGHHKVVVPTDRRLFLISSAHNDVGHHGFYATNALLVERYWWPGMAQDIAWFILTCHLCQLRKTQQIAIPPVVAQPAPLFAKVYMDTMHLTPSGGYKYIVQARCSLTHWPEWEMLRKETSKTIATFILRNIIYRWGTLVEIVTDNGAPFVKALTYLAKHYHITHIRISGYNSRANGLVERSHFDVRQALFKACDGEESKWSSTAYSVFWAERVTVRRRMGCSPYFATTGTHPLLPFDISEANYLLPPPDSILSSTDLISRRAIALQKRRSHLATLHDKVYGARLEAARRFERDHAATIEDFNFKLGDLVLIRNTAIEKALNRKMRARYLGPLIVISRNKGGAYVVAELDGSVLDRPVAAFRVIPYFARTSLDIPSLDELIDISKQRLAQMEDSLATDPDDEEEVVDPLSDD